MLLQTIVETQIAENGTLSIDALRDKTISMLSVEEALIASALMQTENWTLQNNKISAVIDSSFYVEQLKSKEVLINDCISKIYGSPLSISFSLKEEEKTVSNVQIPDKVNMLCKIFKGSITGGKK